MIYFLAFMLTIMLVAGILFLVFVRRIILWVAHKFGGAERTEKTIILLNSPLGKTFIWRYRLKGIFYITLVFYVVIAFTAPKILKYVPLYILFIPLVLGLVLVIPMHIFSRRLSKQDGRERE